MSSRTWSSLQGPWKGRGIAIVGFAGRFPQATTVDAFWRNLLDGRDCISRLTREEMLADGVSPAALELPRFVPAGAVLDDIELFDAAFFGISPREAQSMDPQQRLFLEVVQHAFDDAGFDPSRSPGPVAVYAGCRYSGYWQRLMRNPEFMAMLGWHQIAAGNDKDFLPTQASFRFDLRGPSMNVQAACSTSLLAVSLACDSLVDGRCDVAVAGASSVSVPQRVGYVHQPNGIASSDGLCRPFDAAADGSVLGNAVAAVVLKRVEDALASDDRVYAILRAVAVNNDGNTKSSFAAPSVKAQTEVIARALREAQLEPADIGYIEAHGTATAIGDPIEVAALARVFSGDPARRSPLCIGSVKSNVGHLDPTAGLASLIKTSLCLHDEEIPASLHFERPNASIDFAAANIRVAAKRERWTRGATPRRAGVSAFGIGGTNVHAILEEAPQIEPSVPDAAPQLLVLSAKSAEALRANEAALAQRLREPGAPALADVAFTLATGRRQFKHRRFVVADTSEQAARALTAPESSPPRWIEDRRVVFLFPGQGSQRLRMGLALSRREPDFRRTIDDVLALAAPALGFDGRALIDPEAHGDGTERDLTQTAIAQPLLFAIELACARWWMRCGVEPRGMLGHSLGELVAGHLAGVFSLADAVRVVCARGALMQAMPRGAMLAVALEAQAALALEDDDLRVAAFNAPRQQTISGSCEAIDTLERRLRERGVEFTRLATSHAFHHSSMEEAAARLLKTLRDVRLSPPSVPFLSGMTGTWVADGEAASAEYWARSIVEPVRFSQCVRALLETPATAFIECGPGRALGSLVRAHAPPADSVVIGTLAAQGELDLHGALTALGQAWQAGVAVDWMSVWRERGRRRVGLPGYAFQRQRFWVDAPESQPSAAAAPRHPAMAEPSRSDNVFARTWTPTPWPAANAAATGTWIVLVDGFGPGAALAERLRRDGACASVVHAASEFGAKADDAFGVDPSSALSMQMLVERMAIANGPVHVVNTWTSALPPAPLSIARAQAGAQLGLWAPLRLLRALASAGRAARSLTTITGRLFPIHERETVEPSIATALGLTRVLPQEAPGFSARLIDILPPANAEEATQLVDKLATELRMSGGEPVVALRAGARLVEAFAPFALPAPNPSGVARPGGAYLITGGLGGIGGVLASVIARAKGVRLALLSRRGLGSGADAYSHEVRQRVRELEALGATVVCLAADVSDPKQLAEAVADARARFGRIDGAIHCAGVPGGRMLMMPEDEHAGRVLAPKLQGTIALLEALAPDRPDFVVLCSSFAAIAGGAGQGEYCAGNAFVDAAAWAARAAGIRAIAVDWPAWREVGMAERMSLPPELEHVRRASLASGISPAQGAELFARIVAADMPQVVIAPSATPADSAREPAAAPASVAAPIAFSARPLPRPERAPAAASASGDADQSTERMLTERIGAIWSTVLGIQAPALESNFFELGGQSLMALQIASRIGEQFGVEISLTDIFEHPMLGALSARVHQRMLDRVASLSEERVQEMLARG